MTRPIEATTKDLAEAIGQQDGWRQQNVYGVYGDDLAKILERGARLAADVYRLQAEKEAWSKSQ